MLFFSYKVGISHRKKYLARPCEARNFFGGKQCTNWWCESGMKNVPGLTGSCEIFVYFYYFPKMLSIFFLPGSKVKRYSCMMPTASKRASQRHQGPRSFASKLFRELPNLAKTEFGQTGIPFRASPVKLLNFAKIEYIFCQQQEFTTVEPGRESSTWNSRSLRPWNRPPQLHHKFRKLAKFEATKISLPKGCCGTSARSLFSWSRGFAPWNPTLPRAACGGLLCHSSERASPWANNERKLWNSGHSLLNLKDECQ
jgi:hypothetical protein